MNGFSAPAPSIDDLRERPFFFCGIGGSGMEPLARIVRHMGHEVAGSDRARDQGRLPEKFAALEADGFRLFPQDGSGITDKQQILVASAAVEDSVPEVARARELGCLRLTRAQLLSALFNAAPMRVGIAGTSGKSTVTAMTGWILTEAGRDPTIMNGAAMNNFAASEQRAASARVGEGGVFVSEIDESDGSIALYRPRIGVLLNVSLDHKSMDELRALFGDYLDASESIAVNFDDPEARALARRIIARDADKPLCSFGIESAKARIGVEPGSIEDGAMHISALVCDREHGARARMRLPMPGRHNLSNALAAIAAARLAGVSLEQACEALERFRGLARRFALVGASASGIAVIDDFAHNPEKCAATLRTLKAREGRVIAVFQPHGYGPLRQMGEELAQVFARELGEEDLTLICDPVYFGGTVDRSIGGEQIVEQINRAGGHALFFPTREECGDDIVRRARGGDRVVVMGARDDSLSAFAEDLLARLP